MAANGETRAAEPSLAISDELVAEYTQWRLTKEVLKVLDGFTAVARHEKRAALERFLMTMANTEGPPIASVPKWSTIYRRPAARGGRDLEGGALFRRELRDHVKSSWAGDPASAVAEVYEKVLDRIESAFAEKGYWAPERVRTEIEVGPPPECSVTRARIGAYSETHKEQALARMIEVGGRAATLRALLRYAALGAYGCSWGVPFGGAFALYDDYGVRSEGFASPLNSRLMGLGGASFCSLFPDTDAPFGGVGSFFQSGAPRLCSGTWMVNPPYTEELLDRAAETVLLRAQSSPTYSAFCMFPRWVDSAAYVRLKDSPYLVAIHEIAAKGAFRYEDSLGQQMSGAPTVFFAVSGAPRTDALCARMEAALATLADSGAPLGRSPARDGPKEGARGGRRKKKRSKGGAHS